MFKKYFENRRYFCCMECGTEFSLSFWQWLFTLVHNDITRHRYIKCPRCGKHEWLKAKKVN